MRVAPRIGGGLGLFELVAEVERSRDLVGALAGKIETGVDPALASVHPGTFTLSQDRVTPAPAAEPGRGSGGITRRWAPSRIPLQSGVSRSDG